MGGGEGYGNGEVANGGDEEDRDLKHEVKGGFGLSVNMQKRTIRREGYGKSVSLESNPNLWHIFRILFRAARQQVSLEELKNGYPGEWNANARNQAYHSLRGKLKPLDMTVHKRQLAPITDA